MLKKKKSKKIEFMKLDRSDNQYCLDSDIYTICEHFAERVLVTNKDEYSKRKQYNTEKIKKDIILGKLAEWGVYFIYLCRGNFNINTPDMSIYSKENKSFDSDLKWGLYNLHIKSQSYESSYRYGDSWIFQAKDPLFEFSNEYDIIIGCRVSIDSSSKNASIEILLEKQFQKLTFGDTKLSKFSGNKRAVYLKDNDE